MHCVHQTKPEAFEKGCISKTKKRHLAYVLISWLLCIHTYLFGGCKHAHSKCLFSTCTFDFIVERAKYTATVKYKKGRLNRDNCSSRGI